MQVTSWLARPFMLMAALSIACSLVMDAPACHAQDDIEAALGGEAATDVPAGDADAPDAGDGGVGGVGVGGDNPATGGDADGSKTNEPKNLLSWTFEALGIGYTIIFFALSITLLTLIVMNLIAVRQDNICPPDLVEGVEQQLEQGNAQAAAELVRTDDSFLGQVVTAGLSRLDRGLTNAIEAMQEVGEEETMKLEHNLSYMALIGNISPMIGLFGTVQGMISAFQTIAGSGSTPNPTVLAMNISTALFTTLAGLAIAIPAIAVYNILRNRVQRMTLQVGVTSEELIERFQG